MASKKANGGKKKSSSSKASGKKKAPKKKGKKKTPTSVPSPFGMTKSERDRMTAQDDMRTLDNAMAIRGSKGRMDNVKKEMTRLDDAIKNL